MTVLILLASVLVSQVAPSKMCATPRRNDPLLREAREFAADPKEINGLVMGIPRAPANTVRFVTDEAVCREAAAALGLPGPLLIVRVSNVYLIELTFDPKSPVRTEVWFVHVYDFDWNMLAEYGQGA